MRWQETALVQVWIRSGKLLEKVGHNLRMGQKGPEIFVETRIERQKDAGSVFGRSSASN